MTIEDKVGTAAVACVEYVVPCAACGHTIDAAVASWCHCVAREPNLVCENCDVCLCKLSPQQNLSIWHHAPREIVERRDRERHLRASYAAGMLVSDGDILVVDDDEEIRAIASYTLQQIGYHVVVAATPHEALALLASERPRLVLTDALMPKMDGRELCRLIKSQYPLVKVVIMTSLYTSPRYKNEAYKTFHADGYLAKPIDFSELGRILSTLAPRRNQEHLS